MNRPESRGIVGIMKALLASAIVFCLTATPAFSDNDPRKILEGVYEQDSSHDTSMRAVFDIFDGDGHKATKKFLLFRLGSPGDSKTLVRFTDPAEIRGVTLLSYNHKGDTDRQWLYIPATQRTRSVTPRERSERFVGTDFTYEDVEERALDDFNYRLLSENELIDGHKTYKMEAKPVDAGRSQYRYIYYWVGQNVPVILHAEMYDRDGKLVRELHASALKKVSGIWGARHVEMRSVEGRTRTVLTIDEAKFNQNLDEKLFTPESLENAPTTKHRAAR
jgi:outer membrane lipoprotein-sorting protein